MSITSEIGVTTSTHRRGSGAVDHEFVVAFVEEQAAVLRLAALLCGDRHLAEDVVAEAFARTYPHWRRGGVDNLGAYLRTVVTNEVARRGRRRVLERREAARLSVAGSAAGRSIPHGLGLVDQLVERDRVVRALMTLPPRQRAVVVLRFYDDRSEADIAEILGVSTGTVKSQLSRALARLRPLMTESSESGASGTRRG